MCLRTAEGKVGKKIDKLVSALLTRVLSELWEMIISFVWKVINDILRFRWDEPHIGLYDERHLKFN